MIESILVAFPLIAWLGVILFGLWLNNDVGSTTKYNHDYEVLDYLDKPLDLSPIVCKHCGCKANDDERLCQSCGAPL